MGFKKGYTPWNKGAKGLPSSGSFKPGHKGYWLGKKSPQNTQLDFTCIECGKSYKKAINRKEETKTCSNRCRAKYVGKLHLGENNWIWKSDRVGYMALHSWVTRHLGKPLICEHCNSSERKIYHWANISGEYKRELTDWVRLCPSCHRKYDKGRNSIQKSFDTSYRKL